MEAPKQDALERKARAGALRAVANLPWNRGNEMGAAFLRLADAAAGAA